MQTHCNQTDVEPDASLNLHANKRRIVATPKLRTGWWPWKRSG